MSFNNRSLIKGKYFPPGDKSISHRILILAGQVVGKSKIFNLLQGEDVINTLKAMRLLGVQIFKTNTIVLQKIAKRNLRNLQNIAKFANFCKMGGERVWSAPPKRTSRTINHEGVQTPPLWV